MREKEREREKKTRIIREMEIDTERDRDRQTCKQIYIHNSSKDRQTDGQEFKIYI